MMDIPKQLVLIIDDDVTNLRVLTGYLQKQGFEIMSARTGEDGLEKAGRMPPDLILLDVMMPGIDGFETCRCLKADTKLRDIPVIFLTALNSIVDKVKGFATGSVDYITKPLQEEEVLARVRTHLQLRAQKKQLEQQTIWLKQAKDMSEAAQQMAEKANQAKSAFLANMNHELRTPLNGILGYAQVLKREKGLSPRIQKGLDAINESGKHLLTLISDILDISKIEAGKTALYPEKFIFSDFLESLANTIRVVLKEKDVALRCEFDEDLPETLFADSVRLRQILLNLLGNAAKFTEKGSVDFRVGYCPADSEPRRILFEIQDTGVGIPASQMEKIFLPFEQIGEAEHRIQGTGLGLAISRHLTRLMGGEIRVRSELNTGSCFCFDLAFPEEVPSPERRTFLHQKITGYHGERQKILIVDDNEDNRQILFNALASLGFVIEMAENGAEGLQKAIDTKPNLVLMDLVMPLMTGFEAILKIRKIPDFEKLPVIAMSASFPGENLQQFRNKGFDAFLPKPVDLGELLAVFNILLPSDLICEDEQTQSSEPTEIISDSDIIPPPQKELEILYELAMFGNMERIRVRARHLETTDSRYILFVTKLRAFTDNFEDEKMLSFLESYLSASESS